MKPICNPPNVFQRDILQISRLVFLRNQFLSNRNVMKNIFEMNAPFTGTKSTLFIYKIYEWLDFSVAWDFVL